MPRPSNTAVTLAAAGALTLGLGGWAAAGSLRPAAAVAASEGRVLQVRYEIRRESAYVPPPPTEASRLEVLSAQVPVVVEAGVLDAQAATALRSLQAEDAARTAAALAQVRAADARIDRDTASALAAERVAVAEPESPPAAPEG